MNINTANRIMVCLAALGGILFSVLISTLIALGVVSVWRML